MADVKRPHNIVLVHIGTKEERECAVLGARQGWKLSLGLGPLLGTYVFDVKANRLKLSENAKRLLPWQAQDLDAVERIWKEMMNTK
jgi:hypothetical protein